MKGFDADELQQLRADFPALHQEVHGKPLVYLDNAATTMRAKNVLAAMDHYHNVDNSNIHRGVHLLSQRATDAYEGARKRIQTYLNAASEKEVLFVRGTTEAINLVAQSYLRPRVGPGDVILTTQTEHHANIVPWQFVRDATGCTLKVIPCHDDGSLDQEAFEAMLGPEVKFLAVGHVSNALGVIHPVERMIRKAKEHGITVLVDGAQSVPHMHVDVQALGADFFCFSGHKMYGPTGIGILWGRQEILNDMIPYQGGGDMIMSVTFEKTTYNDLPYKFEAGTPNIAGGIGLGAAVDFLEDLGIDRIAAHEHELLRYATDSFEDRFPTGRILGTAPDKAAVLSFHFDEVHPHDMGTLVDQAGVAVRTGHHCAQPVMQRFGVPATTRASFAAYNTTEEVDRFIAAVNSALEMFT